jgi:hypothetical protein
MCFEIKRLDHDEFDHWSHRDFGDSVRTTRKQRELEVHRMLGADAAATDLLALDLDGENGTIAWLHGVRTSEWVSLAGVGAP